MQSQPVALKNKNQFELYDISGNITEWVQDNFGPFTSTAQIDPIGPITGVDATMKGGSWPVGVLIPTLTSACRFKFARDSRWANAGFRVVRKAK